jgi:hypothetical protein
MRSNVRCVNGKRWRHVFQNLRNLTFRFVSNVDATDVMEANWYLSAEETLFIISSKGAVENLGAGHHASPGMLAGRNRL